MATEDTCCTIVPYFKVHDGQLDTFKEMCKEFVKLADTESKCLYYGFSFDMVSVSTEIRPIAGKVMKMPKDYWRILIMWAPCLVKH